MPDALVLFPVLVPLSGAVIALLLRRRHAWQAGWTLGVMTTSFVFSVLLLARIWQTGQPVIFQIGGWQAPVGITLVGDWLSAFMVVMSQLVLVLGVVYALGAGDKCIHFPTFYPLFLTLGVGLTGAFLTGDIFTLFVFAELLVISGAVLTAISDDRYGAEAAYKYFYISLAASWFLLLAVGALYVSYGTLNMAALAAAIAAEPSQPLLPVAIAMLFAAFMIKSAVFPFHFWQPDFHTVSPTPVSAMLSSIVVKLGVYGFLRMTTLLFVQDAPMLRAILIVLGVAGVIYGGLAALGTHNAKRMLAYSTLAQVGFILVAVGWGTPLALTAALVFTFNHSLIKSALLMLAGVVASRAPVKSADYSVITGVGKKVGSAGALFFIGGLALSGIPPTNGFISKALVFESGFQAEHYLVLAVIGVASILTLVYSTRAFMRVWWQPQAHEGKIKDRGDRMIAPAILILLVLLFGLWAQPLVALAQQTSAWLAEPQQYILAVLGGGG